MRRLSSVLAVALITEATACSAIWGFEEGTLSTAEAGVDTDATASSSGSLSGDGSSADAEPEAGPPPPGCTERMIVPTGFFVTPSGEDIPACGTSNTPCKSIGFLLESIRDGAGEPRVHLGRGVYVEHVDIDAALAAKGLTLEGEWEVRLDGANRQWLPLCTDVQNGRTFIVAPDSRPTLLVTGAAGGDAGTDGGSPASLALSYLQIRSRGLAVPGLVGDDGEPLVSPAGTGESLYGLHVTGANVSLSNSSIAVARGGDGTPGEAGDTGSYGNGACQAGSPGPDGAPGTDAPPTTCSLASEGFVCSEPSSSTDGTRGVSNSCSLGCGGGGKAGGPGMPGGASVSVFLGAGASGRLEGTLLSTGGGGSGGGGGKGGDGAEGGSILNQSCTGDGGRGGYGSPAPGGASFCVAKSPEATLEDSGHACELGAAGSGGRSELPAPAVPIVAADGPRGDVGP